MTQYPEMERVLGLVAAATAGNAGAAEQLGVLLRRLLPRNAIAAFLSRSLAAIGTEDVGHEMATAILMVLARAGVVPPGAHPDNIPSALALRAQEQGVPPTNPVVPE